MCIRDRLYHLTKAENLNSILEDGMIRRFGDTECWFCESLDKMKAYMAQTVLCEGKPYYAVDGKLCRYPKFVPEDYVLLKLTPALKRDNWYRWDQELPPGSPMTLVKAAREFSALKVGYRGDLAFRNAEVIDVADVYKRQLLQCSSAGPLRYRSSCCSPPCFLIRVLPVSTQSHSHGAKAIHETQQKNIGRSCEKRTELCGTAD